MGHQLEQRVLHPKSVHQLRGHRGAGPSSSAGLGGGQLSLLACHLCVISGTGPG